MSLIQSMSHKKNIPTKPITRVPNIVPINHKGILPVVFAIYLTPLFSISFLVIT